MVLIGSKRIRSIVAKEGLIILLLSLVLYSLVTFFLQNIPIILPRYRLEFTNGEVHTINIFPEINNSYNYRRLLEAAHNPPPSIIERRIKEYIKSENIKPALKSKVYINSYQVDISKLYSRLIGLNFVLKLIIIYAFLLFIRFIIWSLRILLKPSSGR